MAIPRQALFQRKGAPDTATSGAPPSVGTAKPSVVIAIGHGKPTEQPTGPDDNSGADAGDVQCPNCGCAFNPETGEISQPPQQGGAPDDAGAQTDGGGDLSSKIAAMMGAKGGQ